MDRAENVKVVTMAAEAREAIAAHARREYPRECCGILIGRGDGVVEAVAAANVAEGERQRDRYVIEPLAIVRADKAAREEGLEIVGFYHSHPDHLAVASAMDMELAWEGYVYVIVSVSAEGAGVMAGWRREAKGSSELIRCVSLAFENFNH